MLCKPSGMCILPISLLFLLPSFPYFSPFWLTTDEELALSSACSNTSHSTTLVSTKIFQTFEKSFEENYFIKNSTTMD